MVKMFNYFAIVCLLGVASAAPYGSYGLTTVESNSVANYGLKYAESNPVTGDNKIHSEVREGDVAENAHSLAEPDGAIRFVDYNADLVSDFNAEVKRVGQPSQSQQTLTPVITKAVASPVISQASMLAPISISSLIDYSGLGGYWDYGLNWGGLDSISEFRGLGNWQH